MRRALRGRRPGGGQARHGGHFPGGADQLSGGGPPAGPPDGAEERGPGAGVLPHQRHGLPDHGVSGRPDPAPAHAGCGQAARPGAAGPAPAADSRPGPAAQLWGHPPGHQPGQPDADGRWVHQAAGLRLRPLPGERKERQRPAQARLCPGGAIPDPGAGILDRRVRPVRHHLLLRHGDPAHPGGGTAGGRRSHPAYPAGGGSHVKTGDGPPMGAGGAAHPQAPDDGHAGPGPVRRSAQT